MNKTEEPTRVEEHPSTLTDNEVDAVPMDKRPEDENGKDIITNPKEKLDSQAQDDKGTTRPVQVSEEITQDRTETFDQNSNGSNGPDTESKKDK